MERLVWGYGDGSTLPVYDTPIGRLGSVICWENYMPLLRMVMYSKNIELDCTPTADDSDTWQIFIRHIALEGRCFALSACQYVTRDAFAEDYDPIRTYWPGLPDGALLPTYSGIRPKLTGQGEAAADFMIQGPTEHGVAGLWNLYGIESPSLTAALALAEVVVLRL